MAYKNKHISNPKTGQEIKFVLTSKETDGNLLEMEATFKAHSKEPPSHYHPYQEEDFTVLLGQITVRMDGQLKILKQGDTLHIPKNKVHSMWNDTERNSIVNWKVQPAMNTEHLFETVFGLAVDGRTNDNGIPGLLQGVLIANKYSNVFRLSKPPLTVQKIMFIILTPFAYLAGYKPSYKKYIE